MCMRWKFRGSMSLISQSLKHKRSYTDYSTHREQILPRSQTKWEKFPTRKHSISSTIVLFVTHNRLLLFCALLVLSGFRYSSSPSPLRFIWLLDIRLRSHTAHSTAQHSTPYRFVLEKAINGWSEQYKPFFLIMIAVRSSADWLAGWLAGHFFIIFSVGFRFICGS